MTHDEQGVRAHHNAHAADARVLRPRRPRPRPARHTLLLLAVAFVMFTICNSPEHETEPED